MPICEVDKALESDVQKTLVAFQTEAYSDARLQSNIDPDAEQGT